MNDLKSALDDFNEAIRLKKDSMFLTNRGRIFAKLGQKARALADFQEAVKADPGDFWPYFERGSLLLKAAKPRQAVADLTQCARLAPETFWKVHYQRGRANTQLGSFTEAVRDYTRALTIHPHPPAFYRRGLLLYELGHPAAMVDFRQCTKLDPKYWKAWLAIGVILAERGAVEKAREVGNRALTLTPDKAGKARIEQFLRALPRR
jgi:tetratricopeptide (TPR) repeat protein